MSYKVVKPFTVELVTLRLPVVVSAVVYYDGNAAIFKENYNAALQRQKAWFMSCKS